MFTFDVEIVFTVIEFQSLCDEICTHLRTHYVLRQVNLLSPGIRADRAWL